MRELLTISPDFPRRCVYSEGVYEVVAGSFSGPTDKIFAASERTCARQSNKMRA